MANATRRERLRAAQQAQQRRRRTRMMAAVGVGVGAVLAIGVMIWLAIGGSGNGQPAANRPPNATAAGDGIVSNPGKAAAGAPVVNVYSDYLCSHCVQFEDTFGFALSDLASRGEIQLIANTKVFLDRGNNEGLSHKAAMAASCADVAGVYDAYRQGIFAAAASGPYTDDLFRVQLPQRTGIAGDALTRFQSCYDNKTMLSWVNGVEEASSKAGVNSTPAMKINGKDVDLGTLPDDASKLKQFILDAAKA
ncbi:MAG: thioredoxin domain-containing protein [Micropruina sp.]|uniref:DsbA family protein n=1 Tax=Micropruina sp. TaxID=2737536 RepID=UPI0039E66FF4